MAERCERRNASSGRPGPVLVTYAGRYSKFSEFIPYDGKKRMNLEVKNLFTEEDIIGAAREIQNARKPIILSGGGTIIAGVTELLRSLSEKLHIPIATTLMGTGSIPGSYPLYTGLLGMHGTRVSNKVVSECDLLINVGARFSDRVISDMKRFAPKAKIMHIDADPAEINKNIPVQIALSGNIEQILKSILDRTEPAKDTEWANGESMDRRLQANLS